MIGGFHVAALVCHRWQQEAERLLLSLAQANLQDGDEACGFTEWLHGDTGHSMGFAQQDWSAAMFLYAEPAVPFRHAVGRQAPGGGVRRGE
ncbi:MAG: hypothetical protein ACE5H9_18005 [Anaerolineae bacterium]